MFNVIYWLVGVTTVAVIRQQVSNIVCVCVFWGGGGVCSLSYPACKAHAPYCIVICVLSGSTIFFHINGTIFKNKKIIEDIFFDFL